MKRVVVTVLVLVFLMGIVFANGDLPSCPSFRTGDVNLDGEVDLSDALYLLNYLYQEGPPPACKEGLLIDEDNIGTISDVIFLLNYLFLGGPEPTGTNVGGIGFLIGENEVRRNDEVVKIIDPAIREEFKMISTTDKRYSQCRYEINSRIIKQTDWEGIEGFVGREFSKEPMEILLTEKDFGEDDFGIFEVICTDMDGNQDKASINIERKLRTVDLLDYEEGKQNLVPLQDIFEGDQIIGTPDQSGCCTITCEDHSGTIVGNTCLEKTQDECDQLNEIWIGQIPETPDEVCDSVFGIYGGFVVKDINWDGTKVCELTQSPPTCKGCYVESMSISYLPEHNYPDEIQIPFPKNYVEQTFPINPNDRNKLGHNEGWGLITTKTKGKDGKIESKVLPSWTFGWHFIVHADLRAGSNPDDCTEGQFVVDQSFLESNDGELDSNTRYIIGGMKSFNQIYTSRKLLDIVNSLPNSEIIDDFTVIPYPIHVGVLKGCYMGSGFLCADDYLAPRGKVKLHIKDDDPSIIWYDNPAIIFFPSFKYVEAIGKNIKQIPGSDVAIMEHFSIKKSTVTQRSFGAYQIIEDYKSNRRFFCRLEYIVWINDPNKATKNQKVQSIPPQVCKCTEQIWSLEKAAWEDQKTTLCG
jgi:hypothetical protein